MSHSEPEFEALLQRAYPGYETQIQGCSPAEIAKIEQYCPVPLPAFYRWFLERFGREPGPLAYPYTDLRGAAVIELYEEEYDASEPSRVPALIIGPTMDPMWPSLCYDLRYPARDDARVRMSTLGKETFREMLAWGMFLRSIIPAFAQTGSGVISADSPSVLEDLTDVMLRLGFTEPLPTGAMTRFFLAPDAALMFEGDFDSNHAVAFHFGATTPTRLREILGQLCREVNMEIWDIEWEPPLESKG